MSDAQVVLLIISTLGGFVASLIGFTIIVGKWMMKRMDKKDERFVAVTDAFIVSTETRSEKFHATASRFDETVREISDKTTEIVMAMSESTTRWKEEWDEAMAEDKEYKEFIKHDFVACQDDERKQTAENLMLIGKALAKLCAALDVKINGEAKFWNGKERRHTDER